MSERTPYDGKPYYCALCGLGLAEYIACEEPGCELETAETALNRARGEHS
jgi:hypothetical protein